MRYLTAVGLLAGAYFAAGTLGQLLAVAPGNVTVVWPSSGIALAAVLLWGDRIWPGIWLGALLVNVRMLFDPTLAPSPATSLAVGAAIATGSTVQALAGRRLVAHLTGGRRFLERTRGVFLFAVAAAIMCLIGSAVGASSLTLGGFIPRAAYWYTWRTWWLGDLAGVIVVAPLLLAWSQHPRAAAVVGNRVEAAVFLILLLAAGQLIFGSWPLSGGSGAPTTYLAFPLLMWAAFRFGQRGATTTVLIMTAMAILGTERGSGPFQDVAVQENLWLLQTYGGVLAISTLVLTALVTENHEMEEGLNDCNQGLERRVAERSVVAEQRAQDLARSEEAYREQTRALQSILDAMPEGVVVSDLRGQSALWNPATERLVGVVRRGIALEEWPSRFGCFLPDQITPYPADRLPLARALRGETVQGEDVFLCNPSRPDGTWLSFSAVPLRNGGGEPVGGVAVFRDVSERKQAELRLRSVIESALAGFVMVDEAGQIALVNRQAEVIFGYTRDELYGQPIEVLVPEHLREDHRRHFASYLRDPQRRPMAASLDIRGLRKDGRTVDLLVALNPIRQDGRLFILASILDVTEQKRASDLVRSVVEFSPDGTVAVDREDRIVLVNREAERMFGYAREELLGQPLGVLVPERSRDQHQELSKQFVAERRQRSMSRGRDLFARRKDGSEFPADISLHSYELNGENFAVANIRDMTERRRLMDELRTNLLIQGVISQILRTSLEPIDVDAQLRRALDLILSVPWFAARAMGEIFLVEGDPDALVLKAQHGLPADVLSRGDPPPCGHCLCGRASRHREVVLAGGPDGRDGSCRPGQTPPHYCVPILDGEHYGIIRVFVDEPHPGRPEEEEFLSSVARILAGTIERRRAEEATRASEERFRQLADTMPQIVWTGRPDGLITYFNDRWYQYTGLTPQVSLVRDGLLTATHPDDRDRFARLRAQSLDSLDGFETEVRLRHRSGAYRWHLLRSVPVPSEAGRVVRRFGTATDIDSLKQAEESLRQSEERFDLAVRGTDAGIWDWDLRTHRIYFSPHWKNMLGYAEDEVRNELSEWEVRVHPDDRDRASRAIQDYLEGRSAEYELEHRLRHKDGSYRWILSRGAAVRDRDGRPYRMVGSHIDITVHKQTADQLNENLAQLKAAQTIQQAMLPKESPALAGLDLAGISYPAAYAGGDMFNYLPMLGGRLGIVIGDVAGHGIGAALEMAAIQAFLRSLTQTCATIGEIMTRINQFVFGETEGESFVTLMLIRLDPRSRSLTYANAGHPPGYILDPLGDVRAELSSSAIPLGIEESCDFPVGEPVVLRPGELVVLVTDGILEAESPEGSFFGSERLLEVIRTTRDRTSHEILEEVHRAVGRHTGTEVFKDDLTAVVIKIGREGS